MEQNSSSEDSRRSLPFHQSPVRSRIQGDDLTNVQQIPLKEENIQERHSNIPNQEQYLGQDQTRMQNTPQQKIPQQQSQQSSSTISSKEIQPTQNTPANTTTLRRINPSEISEPKSRTSAPTAIPIITSPTLPEISYQPYHFAYETSQDPSHFDQPIVFAGPDPDSDPYSDSDSALGENTSEKSITINPSSYEFRHEYGRRYHAENEGAEYHLPNGNAFRIYNLSF
jgi:hypothetical protein